MATPQGAPPLRDALRAHLGDLLDVSLLLGKPGCAARQGPGADTLSTTAHQVGVRALPHERGAILGLAVGRALARCFALCNPLRRTSAMRALKP